MSGRYLQSADVRCGHKAGHHEGLLDAIERLNEQKDRLRAEKRGLREEVEQLTTANAEDRVSRKAEVDACWKALDVIGDQVATVYANLVSLEPDVDQALRDLDAVLAKTKALMAFGRKD